MVKIKIDEEELLEILMNRVRFWADDETVLSLFEDMYKSHIDDGVFDDAEFNAMTIVDNDYINYCQVVAEGDEEFDAVKKVYDEQGLGDCSCENCDGNFIEAVSSDKAAFLIRY